MFFLIRRYLACQNINTARFKGIFLNEELGTPEIFFIFKAHNC